MLLMSTAAPVRRSCPSSSSPTPPEVKNLRISYRPASGWAMVKGWPRLTPRGTWPRRKVRPLNCTVLPRSISSVDISAMNDSALGANPKKGSDPLNLGGQTPFSDSLLRSPLKLEAHHPSQDQPYPQP